MLWGAENELHSSTNRPAGIVAKKVKASVGANSSAVLNEADQLRSSLQVCPREEIRNGIRHPRGSSVSPIRL